MVSGDGKANLFSEVIRLTVLHSGWESVNSADAR